MVKNFLLLYFDNHSKKQYQWFETEKKLNKFIKENLTIRELAKKFNRHERTISDALKDYKVLFLNN